MKTRKLLKNSILPLLIAGMAGLYCTGDDGSGEAAASTGGGITTVATPTFSPAAGAVDAGTVVTISTTTTGATIYYTIDNSDPSPSSTAGSTYTINTAVTIKAIAVKDGSNSAVATAAYTINSGGSDTTAPTAGTAISFTGISDTEMTVNWGAASDSVTSTANLQYRLVKDDAATTNIDSIAEVDAKSGGDVLLDYTANTLTKAVTGLSASTTYHFAVVVKDEADNKTLYTPASQATTAAGTVASPAFGVAAGTYNSDQTVTITSSTTGATICYTTDGSTTPAATTPGTCSTGTSLTNGDSITVSTTQTIKAIATKSGMTNSSESSATYTIDKVAPAWQNSTPSATTKSSTEVDATVRSSEDGTAYYVVVANDATAPSAAQVKAGHDSTDSAATKSGNTSVTASTDATFNITGLSATTAYDAYFVTEDSSGNLMSSPTKVDIATRYAKTITIDGTKDFTASDEDFSGSDSKTFSITWDDSNIYIGVNEALNADNKSLFIIIDKAPVASGSQTARALPFGQWFEGSTITAPFEADYQIFSKYFSGSSEKYMSTYNTSAWDTRTSNPTGYTDFMGASFSEFKVPRALIGNPSSIAISIYMKNLNDNTGWGWTYGVLSETTFTGGTGDKTITKYLSCDLTSTSAPTTACTIAP